MANMRSENVEYAKARRDYPDKKMDSDMMKYRKGGMVKKKKMAGGGMVRGAGCATKGKGKMRMF